MGEPARVREEALPLRVKLGYAVGDHTLNTQLSSLSLYYLFFLTSVAGLSPFLAGLVLLVGRAVDAISDPAMGRISDRTRLGGGRRRPYFLIGALPFGLSFAFLWWSMPVGGELALFAFFSGVYVVNTLASTVLSVPYLALLPELAVGYQERTSLNAFRHVAAITGTLLAAMAVRPLVEQLGGGALGWQRTGLLLGAWLVLPWLVVYAATWERPEFQRRAEVGFVEGARLLLRHRAYRRLTGLYICARIAVDLVSAMFLFYFTYWLARPEDFSITLGILMVGVIVSLPFWLRVSRRVDKRTVFLFGALWWIGAQVAIGLLDPSQPRWLVFVVAGVTAFGYAVADLMPWSMLGDVIDEDELACGERREGVYAGFFTFLRKLGGASGVALAGLVLELAGFRGEGTPSDTAVLAIRGLTAVAPMVFLAFAAWIALGYPITRSRHAAIVLELEERRAQREADSGSGSAGGR